MLCLYSCTANLENIIKAHNKKILNYNSGIRSQCGYAGSCKYALKGGNCRSENIVYRATVNSAFRRGSTSACARLSSDSGMAIIKNLSKVAYMKMTLSFQVCLWLKASNLFKSFS